MSIVVDKYLGREFHWRTYNCWDFIRDVWLDHCGVDLGKRTPEPFSKEELKRTFAAQESDVDGKLIHRLAEPEDPCIVLLVRPNVLSHVGVFVRGKLLHLQPRGNVIHQDLAVASLGFKEVRFYK